MLFLGLGEPDIDALEVLVVPDEQPHHVVLVVGVPELGILSQEVEFLFGEQFFSLLFILDEMEAICLDLYGSIVTFFSLVLRYVLSR